MCNFCKKYFSSIKHPAPAFITCLQDCNNTHPAYAHRRGVECKALHPPSNDARTRDASWYTGRDFSECFSLFSQKRKKEKNESTCAKTTISFTHCICTDYWCGYDGGTDFMDLSLESNQLPPNAWCAGTLFIELER